MANDGNAVPLGRRQMVRLLGAAAGLAAVQPRWPLALTAAGNVQPAAPALPRGSVIRALGGNIDPTTLPGTILFHEHLGNGRRPDGAAVTSPGQDIGWMVEEMRATATHGVSCIVAAQTGLPTAETAAHLTQLAQRSDMRIVLAGGYYTGANYPPEVRTSSEDELADRLVRVATDLHFGAYGEIGVAPDEADLSADEKKVFRAIGKAHLRTGLPIFTHNNYATGPKVPMDMALRQLDLLESVGVKPQSVALGHVCCLDDPTAELAKRIAKRGAFVGFERLTRQQQWITDEQRVKMVMALLDAGYAGSLLFSSDYNGSIATNLGEKEMHSGPLHARDGGPGWARSLVWFDPLLKQAGVSDATIRQIRADNARRFLAFVPKA